MRVTPKTLGRDPTDPATSPHVWSFSIAGTVRSWNSLYGLPWRKP